MKLSKIYRISSVNGGNKSNCASILGRLLPDKRIMVSYCLLPSGEEGSVVHKEVGLPYEDGIPVVGKFYFRPIQHVSGLVVSRADDGEVVDTLVNDEVSSYTLIPRNGMVARHLGTLSKVVNTTVAASGKVVA